MLRHFLVLLGAVLAAALGAGASTAAPRADQIHISINDSFVSDFWTDTCGFEVTISTVRDVHATLVRNKDGLIVSENDKLGSTRVTFSSADGSFSFPAAPSHWDYGDGARVGSTVIATFTGLQGQVAGRVASDAGLFRIAGVVAGFDEFGIPEVELTDVVKDVGHRSDAEDVQAAVCGALSGA